VLPSTTATVVPTLIAVLSSVLFVPAAVSIAPPRSGAIDPSARFESACASVPVVRAEWSGAIIDAARVVRKFGPWVDAHNAIAYGFDEKLFSPITAIEFVG
jgi:hypothetical protein